MKHIYDRGDKPWTDIPWREGIYQLNELWQIRSFWKRGNRWHEIVSEPQTLIQPWKKRLKKYWPKAEVTLFDWFKHKHYYLSRLMAMTYMWLNINDKTKNVIHKDSNWMNCRLDNLVIATPSRRVIQYMNSKYKDNENPWLVAECFKLWGYFQIEDFKKINPDSYNKDQLINLLCVVMEQYNNMYEQYGSLND